MYKSILPTLLCLCLLSPTVAADSPTEGQPAPAFKLQDQTSTWHELGDYQGQWLVLYFYPKDFTPGCTTEACTFRDDIFKFHSQNIALLGVSMDDVSYTNGDTDSAPESTAASGSKATRSVGQAAMYAAKDLREKILSIAASKLEADEEDLVFEDGKVKVASAPDRSITLAQIASQAPSISGFLIGQGETAKPPPCPIHTAQVAEVAVNQDLGEVRVLRLICVQDVGFAINPLSVAGQIEGAMIQGLGLALMEELPRTQAGNLLGESLHEYLVPTSLDMPELKAVLMDNPAEGTPFGMRGVGEPPIVATAAAIVNAIHDAVGAPLFSIPVGPHHVREAIEGVRNGNAHAGLLAGAAS